MRASHLVSLLTLLTLCACPPPTGTCAERQFVSAQGDIPTGGLIFPSDAGGPPLGVVGRPLTTKVFAPRTGCERDQLSARVELLGPDNFPVTDLTLTEPKLVGQIVSVEVTFTPSQPGQYLMQLVFEPALGVRSLLLDVAELRTSPPAIRVDVPNFASCLDSVWPVNADTVACERTSKTVELYSSDGGTTSFQGEQLVVAGRVLWSVAPTSELERREFVDGGLVVTHRFPDFDNRSIRGMHDEATALRVLNSGALVFVNIDAGVPVLDLNRQSNAVGDQLLFVERGVLSSETACSFEPCFTLRALEPGIRWYSSVNGGVDGLKLGREEGFGPDATIPYTAEPVQPPQRGFERVPLWLTLPGTPLSVLVNADRPSFGFTAWNRLDVLRVGKEFVVLRKASPASDVLVTPR